MLSLSTTDRAHLQKVLDQLLTAQTHEAEARQAASDQQTIAQEARLAEQQSREAAEAAMQEAQSAADRAAAAETQCAKLQKELRAKDDRINSLRTVDKGLHTALNLKEASLQNASQRLQDMSTQHDQALKDRDAIITKLRTDNENLRSTVRQMTKQNEQLQQELHATSGRLANEEKAASLSSVGQQNAQREAADLSQRVQYLEAQMKDMAEQHQKREHESSQLVADLRSHLVDLYDKLTQVSAMVQETTDMASKSELRAQKAERSRLSQARTRPDLREAPASKFRNLMVENDLLRAELDRYKGLEEQNRALQAKLSEYEKQRENTNQAFRSIRSVVSGLGSTTDTRSTQSSGSTGTAPSHTPSEHSQHHPPTETNPTSPSSSHPPRINPKPVSRSRVAPVINPRKKQ